MLEDENRLEERVDPRIAEQITKEALQASGNSDHCEGGICNEKSECCGASISLSGGGVIQEICSRCGKVQTPHMYA
jgi:hypothetical protein